MKNSAKRNRLALGFALFCVLISSFQDRSFAQQASTETVNQMNERFVYLEELPKASQFPLSFIEWDQTNIKTMTSGKNIKFDLSGTFSRPVKEMKYDDFPVPLQKNNSFLIQITVPDREDIDIKQKEFVISCLTEDGNLYLGTYRLTISREKDPNVLKGGKQVLNDVTYRKKLRFSFGAGYTQLRYVQTDVTPITESTLTVKGGVGYALTSKWDLSLSAFYNAKVLKSSDPENQIRYLGVNTRIAYAILPAPKRFQFRLAAGSYYSVSYGLIGFNNLFGFQLYPEFRFQLTPKLALASYVKFSPIFVGSKLSPSKNREMATGLGIIWSRYSLNLDLAKLELSQSDDVGITSATASNTATSLSLGVMF